MNEPSSFYGTQESSITILLQLKTAKNPVSETGIPIKIADY
jgi:hypothetical protein